MSQFKILTPHAAVIVWNYADRFGTEEGKDENSIEETIISTLSCISIQTAKTKSNPAGTFQLVLSPFKNWVSTINTGSWCCILMSNKKITPESLNKADPAMVKMIGKIETVRCDTQQVGDTRQTRYLVTGVDWGHVFNNALYIDNFIQSANSPRSQGNDAAVVIRNALFGNGNAPQSFAVKDNLSSLLKIFGNNLAGFTQKQDDINHLAKPTYDLRMPKEMVNFFNFVTPSGVDKKEKEVLTRNLTLRTGRLTAPDLYDDTAEAFGYINPFTLQGTNSFWQILLDNSNPALNEMFNEIRWVGDRPSLTLYNRIKPFAFKSSSSDDATVKKLKSMFQLVKTHEIDPLTVISLNAGTNWRDKYNFIEIKPQFQDFDVIANWSKQKTQEADQKAFNREGFRPMIVGTKQFPVAPGGKAFNPDLLRSWVLLMKEWYFDTHRLLNGTLTMVGGDEYIAVGNNIRFDAGLLNPTPNLNKASNKAKKNEYILAHVESVSHSFTVAEDGARQYITTIQFVRGISVNQNNALFGEGKLDKRPNDLTPEDDRNTKNVISTSESDDPDPQKVNGT